MPQVRKTRRGPQTTTSKPPFELADWDKLLRKDVIKKSTIALNDAKIVPLMHVANILQSWVRAADELDAMLRYATKRKYEPEDLFWEKEGREDLRAVRSMRLQALSTWVTDGISPTRKPAGELFEPPQRNVGGHWQMLDAAEHAIGLAARQHAFDLVSGNSPNSYRDWLMKRRAPLIARPIRQWTDYAPDLHLIFRAELYPEDCAAWRFIEKTAPTITGESPTFQAVRTELMRERWQKRKGQMRV
jgi:hypothetical protein